MVTKTTVSYRTAAQWAADGQSSFPCPSGNVRQFIDSTYTSTSNLTPHLPHLDKFPNDESTSDTNAISQGSTSAEPVPRHSTVSTLPPAYTVSPPTPSLSSYSLTNIFSLRSMPRIRGEPRLYRHRRSRPSRVQKFRMFR